MKKYLLLHSKRIFRILPFVLVVTAVLFGSLAVAFQVIRRMDEDSSLNVKFKIGIVGTADDKYLSMGLAAFQSMDSTQYSIDLVQMTEKQAQQQMLTRDLAAYVVFPEGFMNAALHGEIMPIKYVSTTGSVDMIALMKDEITQMIEDILYESQRGTYGVGDVLWSNGMSSEAGDHINDLAIEYVEMILVRGKLYTASELGISDGLGMKGFLLSSFSVLFLLLLCMPYAPLMIRSDRTMERLLASRKIDALKQISAEFGIFFLSLFAMFAGAVALISTTGVLYAYILDVWAVLKLLTVVLCIAAWSFFCYEISRNMVGGVLLQFFSAVAMAFVCGCMYPSYFFPETLQKIGNVLPAGAARLQIAGCLSGADTTQSTFMLLGYSAGFLLISAAVRVYAIRGDRR